MKYRRFFGVDESGTGKVDGHCSCILVATNSDQNTSVAETNYVSKERGSDGRFVYDFRYLVINEELISLAADLFNCNFWPAFPGNKKSPRHRLQVLAEAVLLADTGFGTDSVAVIDSFCPTLQTQLNFYLSRLIGSNGSPLAIACESHADLRFPLVHEADRIASYIFRRTRDEKGALRRLDGEYPGRRADFSPARFVDLWIKMPNDNGHGNGNGHHPAYVPVSMVAEKTRDSEKRMGYRNGHYGRHPGRS